MWCGGIHWQMSVLLLNDFTYNTRHVSDDWGYISHHTDILLHVLFSQCIQISRCVRLCGGVQSAVRLDFEVEHNLQSGWTLRWSAICNQARLWGGAQYAIRLDFEVEHNLQSSWTLRWSAICSCVLCCGIGDCRQPICLQIEITQQWYMFVQILEHSIHKVWTVMYMILFRNEKPQPMCHHLPTNRQAWPSLKINGISMWNGDRMKHATHWSFLSS